MRSYIPLSSPSHPARRLAMRPVLTALVLSLPAFSPAAAQFHVPVRVTFNNVEDRTTTGSIARTCYYSAAVWMQEQAGPGWNLMWAREGQSTWSQALPLEIASHEDYEPRIMVPEHSDQIHAVWQRQTGAAAEIMHGAYAGQGWAVEPITINSTEDLSPDIASQADGRLHVTWAGFDPKSGEGKIFYAKKDLSPPGPWVIEMLAGSELGPFWTGAQPKIDIAPFHDIIHIVYRGGNFGIYNTHYARRNPNGVWSYQILTSLNAEDLVADVANGSNLFYPDRVVIAMSGNDCFGCPSRVYARRSTDYGLTFSSPELVSGSHSAELGAIAAGTVDDLSVVAAELSGNIFTGDLLLSRDLDQLAPGTLPPANHSSFSPSITQDLCYGRGDINYGGLAIAFTNYGSEKAPADSAEVWSIKGHAPVLDVDNSPVAPPAQLALTASPNPFSSSTVITATSLGPGSDVELTIYDSLGRLVRRFTDATPDASLSRSWHWDGLDASGRVAPSGVFFLETKQGTARAIDRLILIR
jgi:hypothetical protein